MATYKIFDVINATWTSNTSSSVNPVPSDNFSASIDSADKELVVTNQASKEDAGGLVSTNIPYESWMSFFGLDVEIDLSAFDLPHLFRMENDLKVTLTGGMQANVSTQFNFTDKNWQLDPTGKGWVDTGYKIAPVVGRNKWQVRASFVNGVWSVTGLRFNDDPNIFIPSPATFANIPQIATNWGAGLHPQLQTEVNGAPWILREEYARVRVIGADSAIPFLFD